MWGLEWGCSGLVIAAVGCTMKLKFRGVPGKVSLLVGNGQWTQQQGHVVDTATGSCGKVGNHPGWQLVGHVPTVLPPTPSAATLLCARPMRPTTHPERMRPQPHSDPHHPHPGPPRPQYDAFDIGVTTTDDFANADVLYDESLPRIKASLTRAPGSPKAVAIVTGFLGKGQSTGAITTLGRGGSDLTATVLGAALELSEVQVRRLGMACTDDAEECRKLQQSVMRARGKELEVAIGCSRRFAGRTEGRVQWLLPVAAS